MIRRSFESIVATWLAGLLMLLPLALTLAVLAWVLKQVSRFLGPSSIVGMLFAKLGYPFASNRNLRYVFGALVLIAAIWVLGVLVRSRLQRPLASLTDRTFRRIPIVGGVYNVAERLVGLLDQQQGADIGAMSPGWCFFGGSGAAAKHGSLRGLIRPLISQCRADVKRRRRCSPGHGVQRT